MKRPDDEILNRWLTAERDDAPSAAERALHELLLSLPYESPSPGFAQRVLLASVLPSGITPGYVWGRPFFRLPSLSGWTQRAAVAFCLLFASVTAAYMPLLARFLSAKISLSGMVTALVTTFVEIIDQAAAFFTVWRAFDTLHSALVTVVTSPPVVITWFLALAFSTLTLRWLRQLLNPHRSSEYVAAH